MAARRLGRLPLPPWAAHPHRVGMATRPPPPVAADAPARPLPPPAAAAAAAAAASSSLAPSAAAPLPAPPPAGGTLPPGAIRPRRSAADPAAAVLPGRGQYPPPPPPPLTVLHDCGRYLAVDKPPHVRIDGDWPVTVEKMALAHLAAARPAALAAGLARPKLVHQLDFATSGVLLLALDRRAAAAAAAQFASRAARKLYVALVDGRVPPGGGCAGGQWRRWGGGLSHGRPARRRRWGRRQRRRRRSCGGRGWGRGVGGDGGECRPAPPSRQSRPHDRHPAGDGVARHPPRLPRRPRAPHGSAAPAAGALGGGGAPDCRRRDWRGGGGAAAGPAAGGPDGGGGAAATHRRRRRRGRGPPPPPRMMLHAWRLRVDGLPPPLGRLDVTAADPFAGLLSAATPVAGAAARVAAAMDRPVSAAEAAAAGRVNKRNRGRRGTFGGRSSWVAAGGCWQAAADGTFSADGCRGCGRQIAESCGWTAVARVRTAPSKRHPGRHAS
ncbi:hypothetical protein BU14_0167s0013 [Porphyra umbilicalis]|uniref:Pseudouridine synthase RsuA/RluA-like domain-containing protein n=1 Tax=Porphyra umbilicalis TaxID=2786 RepID=A0A1X6P7W3_PORUM|nr:hypothetical protein BU14_0167s0013 [Porphyra umbilicalis]|eukprot:OSX76938.1 hypothetical protein BU14_0167s0013 [Porphyra umbilicalis]